MGKELPHTDLRRRNKNSQETYEERVQYQQASGTTTRYHLTPGRLAVIQNTEVTDAVEGPAKGSSIHGSQNKGSAKVPIIR